MKSLLLASVVALTAGSSALAGGGFPAEPGQCFGQVALPGHEERRVMSVLQAPGHVERRYAPAVVEQRWRSVLVRPARLERERVPALYRTVSTSYVAPGPRRWEHTPDRYAVQSERVIVAPGHWIWQRRFGPVVSGPPQPGQTLVQPTGEIMCRVWCPARYEDVSRNVLVERGHAYAISTTARRWVTHTVMMRPASFVVHRIPAQYRQVAETRVIRPAHTEVFRVAPRYGLAEDRRMVGGGMGWSRVVCGGPLSRPAMQRMQSSLAAQGYDPGPADGLGRAQTYDALRRFQMDRRMPAGQVTVDSARALGVIP